MQKIKALIGGKSAAKDAQEQSRNQIITSIIRMSQKALVWVLVMIGTGYIGGLIAILFKPELSAAMTEYAQIFIPVFQLEIGVYGLGSTLENVQKIKTQVDRITQKTQQEAPEQAENANGTEEEPENG